MSNYQVCEHRLRRRVRQNAATVAVLNALGLRSYKCGQCEERFIARHAERLHFRLYDFFFRKNPQQTTARTASKNDHSGAETKPVNSSETPPASLPKPILLTRDALSYRVDAREFKLALKLDSIVGKVRFQNSDSPALHVFTIAGEYTLDEPLQQGIALEHELLQSLHFKVNAQALLCILKLKRPLSESKPKTLLRDGKLFLQISFADE